MAILQSNRPKVAIFMSHAYQSHRELLEGMLKFIKLRSPWIVNVEMGRAGEPRHTDLAQWGCTGIITNRRDPHLIAFTRKSNVPVVTHMNPAIPGNVIGDIVCDNVSIGETAARHLAALGLEHFAFIGETSGCGWSLERGRAFKRKLAMLGKSCRLYLKAPLAVRDDAAQEHRCCKDWIAQLPKPIGIFTAHDLRARQVLDICHEAGLSVPRDAAILGVDNDAIICETANPPLSSIALATRDAGFRAAELLDNAMSGRLTNGMRKDILYGDTEVILRASTDRRAVSDPLAEHCLELVASNPDRRVGVSELAKQLGISRRTLENHVKTATGQTVADIITNHRIERAKALLRETSLPLERIAETCGFCDASHLSNVFRRRCGKSASAYRL